MAKMENFVISPTMKAFIVRNINMNLFTNQYYAIMLFKLSLLRVLGDGQRLSRVPGNADVHGQQQPVAIRLTVRSTAYKGKETKT